MRYTKDSELVQRIVEAVENCDPLASTETLCKSVADVLNASPPREWTAEDVSDLPGINRKGNALLVYAWGETEAASAAICHDAAKLRQVIRDEITGDDDPEIERVMSNLVGNDFREHGDYEESYEIGGLYIRDVHVAAAANIMRVPKPQPVAVDVERLAVAIESRLKAEDRLLYSGTSTKESIADTLRRELSQEKGGAERLAAAGEQGSSEWQAFEVRRRRAVSDRLGINTSQSTAAESEWPADAPEWATEIRCGVDDVAMFWGVVRHGLRWSWESAIYRGPRPASWAGKPWTECVLRRPGGASER